MVTVSNGHSLGIPAICRIYDTANDVRKTRGLRLTCTTLTRMFRGALWIALPYRYVPGARLVALGVLSTGYCVAIMAFSSSKGPKRTQANHSSSAGKELAVADIAKLLRRHFDIHGSISHVVVTPHACS